MSEHVQVRVSWSNHAWGRLLPWGRRRRGLRLAIDVQSGDLGPVACRCGERLVENAEAAWFEYKGYASASPDPADVGKIYPYTWHGHRRELLLVPDLILLPRDGSGVERFGLPARARRGKPAIRRRPRGTGWVIRRRDGTRLFSHELRAPRPSPDWRPVIKIYCPACGFATTIDILALDAQAIAHGVD